MKADGKKSVILFDGVCNLCNSSVQFVLKHDKKQHFLLTSLQSDAATKLLLHYKTDNSYLNSIILIEDDKIYEKSSAVLRIVRKLTPFWNLFYGFIIIPKSIRDFVYSLVARNRVRWFGKMNQCAVYSPKYKNRFI